jgi:hypothetical protein
MHCSSTPLLVVSVGALLACIGPDACVAGGRAEGDDPGECTDRADNDRDGSFDCDDPDCAASPDCGATDTASVPADTSEDTPEDTGTGDDTSQDTGAGVSSCILEGASMCFDFVDFTDYVEWCQDMMDRYGLSSAMYLEQSCDTRGRVGMCDVARNVSPNDDFRVDTTIHYYEGLWDAASAESHCERLGGTPR